MRDPNFTDKLYDSQNASFGFSYSSDADIYEALIFKVKRSDKPLDNTNNWKVVTENQLLSNVTLDNKFRVLNVPIPVRKIRFDMLSKVGKDGSNAYTIIQICSKSNPNYKIELGHFFANGMINIDGSVFWGGTLINNSIYEFDLTSWGNDWVIYSYQSNFNFNNLTIL